MMDYLLIFTTHSIRPYFIEMYERASVSRKDAQCLSSFSTLAWRLDETLK